MIRAACAVTLLLIAVPAQARVSQWDLYIAEASQRFGVPTGWIERVIQAESAGKVTLDGRPITSRAGAMGLMQLMPATWTAMRWRYRLGPDPYDPHDNILAGTAYLRAMYDRFGYPGLFAAYNAGPSRYTAHLATGAALPAETRAYLAAVTGRDRVVASLPSQSLFAIDRASQPLPARAASSLVPSASLFVPLSQR